MVAWLGSDWRETSPGAAPGAAGVAEGGGRKEMEEGRRGGSGRQGGKGKEEGGEGERKGVTERDVGIGSS